MASLPPSHRSRASPTQRSSSPEAPSQSVNRTNSEAQSTRSEDSQKILLNPHASSSKNQEKSSSEEETRDKPMPKEDDDIRRCWICFTDETEDAPAASEWRSPCPCALVAHESCLLDWVADMEAPNSRRKKGPNDKILCPQCKSEIKLARPRSLIVDAVKELEIISSKMVLPSILCLSTWSVYSLCWAHGASSVLLVFGQQDGERVLAPVVRPPPHPDAHLQEFIDHIKQRLRLDIGLASIPAMLVVSRTTLGDGILPILPMLFFITKPDADSLTDFGSWPPSAGLSFALLPYVRSIYNHYYERVWGEHERRWLKELQPRATADSQEEVANGVNAADDEDNVLEIQVNLDMLEEWDSDDDNEPPPLEGERIAHPLNEPPLDAVGRAEEQPGIPAVAPAPDVPRHRNRHHHLHGNGQANAGAAPAPPLADANPQPPAERNFNLALSTNRLAESVLGALAFPAVSAVMGEVLRLVLPKSWTSFALGKPGRPTGLLQQKWGRSLVGGAMFVVLKDAVMLYVRWRMARDHRMRKVLDYKGKRPGGRASKAA